MKIKVILFSLLLSGALLVYVFAVYAQQTGNSQKMNIQIDNKTFTVIVENNKAVKELYQKLPITLEMSQVPAAIRSFAFPSQTSVPCERPDICKRSEKFFGFASSSI